MYRVVLYPILMRKARIVYVGLSSEKKNDHYGLHFFFFLLNDHYVLHFKSWFSEKKKCEKVEPCMIKFVLHVTLCTFGKELFHQGFSLVGVCLLKNTGPGY